MKITSFDGNKENRINRDENGQFNLFQRNMVMNKNLSLSVYIVPREYEMRLDRISNHIYGSPYYVEELMVMNDVINPYSIKEGQYIYFCNVGDLPSLYVQDKLLDTAEKTKKDIIASSSKNASKNPKGLPVTIMPDNLKQITVSDDNNISIINSFE